MEMRCGSVSNLSDLLEVVVAFLQRPRSVERLPHAGVFVEENLPVLLHPIQHLQEKQNLTQRLENIDLNGDFG